MRTLSVVCIVTLFFGNAFAQEQIKQNVYSLGGSIFYLSTTEKSPDVEIDESTYLFMPSISYFIADQCELSVNIGYERSSSTYSNSMSLDPSPETRVTILDAGLGIRYYYPVGKIAPFIGASGGVSWEAYQNQTFSTPQTNFNLIGGLEIFISPSAAIEPAIQYTTYRYSDQTSSNGIRVGIGVKYFIL